MPKRVDVGKEIIEFPDDMPDSEIDDVLRKLYPPEKPRPTAGSRFLENTVKPIEAVSDSIQASMRSQNPIGDLASKAANVVGGVVRDPMGTVRAVAQPFVNVGSDLMNGDIGAAVGGLTGLALPFLPRGAKAAAKGARVAAPVIMDAGRGAMSGAKAPAQLPGIRIKGVPLELDTQVPGSVAGGLSGAMLGHQLAGGMGAVAGGVIGSGYPIVKGAVKAVREGIEARNTPPPIPPTAPVVKVRKPRARPMTKATRAAEDQATPSPESPTAPAADIPPDSVIAGKSEAMQKIAKDLADMMGDTGPKVEAPTVQFEAGARAKKVWNTADFLHEYGFTADLVENAPQATRNAIIEQLNRARREAGDVKNIHQPPSPQTWGQTMKELREIEARKANNQ
jgi:hypothetical protein